MLARLAAPVYEVALPRSRRVAALAGALGLVLGCTGEISHAGGPSDFPAAAANPRAGSNAAEPGSPAELGEPGDGPEGRSVTFDCDPELTSDSVPLRRLSRVEYTNALGDLLRASLTAATADRVLLGVRGQIDALPADSTSKRAPFARMDQSVSQPHVDAYFALGSSVAGAVTAQASLGELLGDCAGETQAAAADACIEQFIAQFGRRALRHRLTDEEIAFYREVYAAPGAIDRRALADVIAVMLNAPDFIYEVQAGTSDEVSGDAPLELDDFEIAARLAFVFWQTAPDATLLEAAGRGELSDGAGYETAVDQVLDDPRTAQALRAFSREWFELDALAPLDALVGEPRFDAFAGALVPSPELRADMIADVTESFVYHALSAGSTLAEWVASPFSFARTPELAAIYDVPVWDGAGAPPEFPRGTRAGLLTRAALLTTGSWNTRPIKKGAMLRERVLCDELPPPPANAVLVPPEPAADQTTRARVEALTEQPGSQCASCHAVLINPLGFATEGYDALGRLRTHQSIFDERGQVIAELEVATDSVPRIFADDSTRANGAADLTELVIASGKTEACLSRQLVRFMAARPEDESLDGCALEQIRRGLEEGQSVREVLRGVALAANFRTRISPPAP